MSCDKFKTYCHLGAKCEKEHKHSDTNIEDISRKLDIVIGQIHDMQQRNNVLVPILIEGSRMTRIIIDMIQEIKGKVDRLWGANFRRRCDDLESKLNSLESVSSTNLQDRGNLLRKRHPFKKS